MHRAIAEHLAGRYRAAAAAERVTWHDAELAATRDSLRAEAAAVLAAPHSKAAQPTRSAAAQPAAVVARAA